MTILAHFMSILLEMKVRWPPFWRVYLAGHLSDHYPLHITLHLLLRCNDKVELHVRKSSVTVYSAWNHGARPSWQQ